MLVVTVADDTAATVFWCLLLSSAPLVVLVVVVLALVVVAPRMGVVLVCISTWVALQLCGREPPSLSNLGFMHSLNAGLLQ